MPGMTYWVIRVTAVLSIVLALLGAYAACYVVLGYRQAWTSKKAVSRTYTSRWQCNLFGPLARVEARVRGIQVHLYCGTPGGPSEFVLYHVPIPASEYAVQP